MAEYSGFFPRRTAFSIDWSWTILFLTTSMYPFKANTIWSISLSHVLESPDFEEIGSGQGACLNWLSVERATAPSQLFETRIGVTCILVGLPVDIAYGLVEIRC